MRRYPLALALVLAAVAAFAVISTGGASARQSASMIVSHTAKTDGVNCTFSNRSSWTTEADCNYNTLITVTGGSWTCSHTLSFYGTPPIRVVDNEGTATPSTWTGGTAGKIILTNGCTEPSADFSAGDIDLLADAPGLGPKVDTYGNGQDMLKYNGSTGPQSLYWSVEGMCGVVSSGAHQDGLQAQNGANVYLVNPEIGNASTGAEACNGAGGAMFYSSANGHFPGPNVDVYGGYMAACGKGLYGGNDTAHGGGYPIGNSTGHVEDTTFHTGGGLYNGSADPNCGGIFSSSPCAVGNTVTTTNLTCIGSSGNPPPPDTTAPTVTCSPEGQVVEATSSSGATATWSCSATDPDDAAGPVSCSPSSGSTFALGSTDVTCQSTDTHSNTGYDTFQIVVQDTTAPSISGMPSNATIEATGPAGAVDSWTAPTATDAVDGTDVVTCNPPSGSTFALGTTTVTCSSTDAANNTSSATFTVTVQDTTPPVISGTPSNQTAEATSSSGAAVSWTAPTATDLVDVTDTVACSPASGSTFALDATTTVTCSSTDAHSNTSSTSFTVHVQDTTAPAVSCGGNQTVEATSSSGATASWTCSATDAVDGTDTVSCDHTSGATYAIGTTTVSCSATDAHSNVGNNSFTITVQDTTAPTAPSSVHVSCDGAGICSLYLHWNASTDAVGVTGYNVYQDGTLKTTTTSLSYHLTGLVHTHTYALKVEAFDAAGNKSSTTINYTA